MEYGLLLVLIGLVGFGAEVLQNQIQVVVKEEHSDEFDVVGVDILVSVDLPRDALVQEHFTLF